MLRGFTFEIYPSLEQKEMFWKMAGCNRLVWNLCIDHCKKVYDKSGKTPSANDLCSFITSLKQTKKYYFLNEVDSKSFQCTAYFLRDAFVRFFQKKNGYPKYKSRKHKIQSYTTDSGTVLNFNNLDFENHTVVIPKFGKVHSYLYRQFEGQIKRATIKYEGNRYWISYCVEVEELKPLPKVKQECAIDAGVNSVVTIYSKKKNSQGKHFTKVDNQRFLNKTRKKITKLQRNLSRKQKGSNNYYKVKNKLNKAWFRLRNQRKDFLHKLSRSIINDNQVIYVEDLNIKAMMKSKETNSKLKDSISDVSWYKLFQFLNYKAEEAGRHIEFVNPKNTSKKCYNCGFLNKKVVLGFEKWICPHCGIKHDRDKNAAKNIFMKGHRNLYQAGVGTHRL